MSDEGILAIARETGAWHICPQGREELLITFARRVQAAQKEKDARICETMVVEYTNTYPPGGMYKRTPYAHEAAAAIREQSDE